MICKTVVIFLLYSSLSFAIDEDAVKDMKCIKPQPSVARNVDYKSLLSIKKHYMPLQSQLNYYRMVSSLLEKSISDLQESDLNSTSCIIYKWGDPSPKLYGFGNKTVTYITTPIFENSFGFKGTWEKDKRARSFITMKADKHFIFFTNCWEDEEASWAVISTTKTFKPAVLKSILDHAKSLGFNETLVVHQNYEGCLDIMNENRNDKSEL